MTLAILEKCEPVLRHIVPPDTTANFDDERSRDQHMCQGLLGKFCIFVKFFLFSKIFAFFVIITGNKFRCGLIANSKSEHESHSKSNFWPSIGKVTT